jgi:hypothetical protein
MRIRKGYKINTENVSASVVLDTTCGKSTPS